MMLQKHLLKRMHKLLFLKSSFPHFQMDACEQLVPVIECNIFGRSFHFIASLFYYSKIESSIVNSTEVVILP